MGGTHRTEPSYCRFCTNGCPILVEIEDGRAVGVTGDPSNDVYAGYTCVKGRALAEHHNHPDRLLHSQKRMPDGTFAPISSEQVMDEVAARLAEIVERHGPNSVALYFGTMVIISPVVVAMCTSFIAGLGSRMMFNPATIDQPGKNVAKALHGSWGAPGNGFDDPDVGLVVGSNPFVSYTAGLPLGHPGKWLQRWSERGYELVVIDPRRSDFAKRATIHLQPRPGEDAAILAGMLRVIFTEELHDRAFVEENVAGLEQLRAAVAPFTPAVVADRADIDAGDLVAAARVFARGTRGVACAGTGPNFSGPGTLVEYLLLTLNTVCGRWLRAGERVRVPGVTVPAVPLRAQAKAPTPAFDLTEPVPGTELRGSAAGLPTAALPAAILHDGDDRIRALISISGNPAAAWPDQLKAVDALRHLDLLVQLDVTMSNTAQLADYVVAPKMSLETPASTLTQDGLTLMYPGIGYGEPWAQYTPAIVDPPAGSDLLEEWEFLYGLAQRLKLEVRFGAKVAGGAGVGAQEVLDLETKPTADELLELCMSGSRVPLEELRRHPHGALFPDPSVVVLPKDAACEDRLDVGNAAMMRDLEALATAGGSGEPVVLADGETLDLRLIPRRIQQAINSSGRNLTGLRKPYNPAFLHPDDLARRGLVAGDLVEIRSQRSTITAVVEPDDTLRPGLVSMTHAFGGLPDDGDGDVRRDGVNTGRLLQVEEAVQPYTGQPLMGNVPVSVWPVSARTPSARDGAGRARART
jgi:anaerobic selenocysteine-containing dehydrogenase